MKIRQGKVVKFSRTVKNFTKTKEENKSMHSELVTFIDVAGFGESRSPFWWILSHYSNQALLLLFYLTFPPFLRLSAHTYNSILFHYFYIYLFNVEAVLQTLMKFEIPWKSLLLLHWIISQFSPLTSHIFALFFTVFLIFSQNLLRDRLEMQSCLRICWKTTISVSFTSNVKYLGVSFSTQVSKTAGLKGLFCFVVVVLVSIFVCSCTLLTFFFVWLKFDACWTFVYGWLLNIA